ncbi:hypothetical protein LY28_02206 [Ruminiclostridium sufflavum DSM 19573]|uniref:Uncharacterized protein n=1 Tax=Ruminiclostridium sufflavum DSM 19573 TaxID=1121337 RepID=A0A318XL61_9FIRM|nr:hypothetical protein [Ruminiclostridium sufflavum]PYG87301.1 hypothetical protein LY28_02206 [Ruminiclostridium sufflavum DSM 19573]
MIVKFENKRLPNSKSEPNPQNYSNLKCKHINYLNFHPQIDPKAVICSNSEIQFLASILYCYNESSLRIQYTPPANLVNIEVLTLPTVQALTSTFKEVTVLTDGERILQFYLKGLLNECEEVFSRLWNTCSIDKSIISCFREKNSLDIISPIIPPITYELLGDNSVLDEKLMPSCILNNTFLSFLLTQCIRNDMFLTIPIKGWKLEEIESCKYFCMLPYIFKNVWFCGFGDTWISDRLIVYQPYKSIISEFLHLYRSCNVESNV